MTSSSSYVVFHYCNFGVNFLVNGWKQGFHLKDTDLNSMFFNHENITRVVERNCFFYVKFKEHWKDLKKSTKMNRKNDLFNTIQKMILIHKYSFYFILFTFLYPNKYEPNFMFRSYPNKYEPNFMFRSSLQASSVY